MSAKALDTHGRWRNVTVAFRVSPEEDSQIETLVGLSGLTKQDYIMSRLLNRDVVVKGNPGPSSYTPLMPANACYCCISNKFDCSRFLQKTPLLRGFIQVKTPYAFSDHFGFISFNCHNVAGVHIICDSHQANIAFKRNHIIILFKLIHICGLDGVVYSADLGIMPMTIFFSCICCQHY